MNYSSLLPSPFSLLPTNNYNSTDNTTFHGM